MDNKQFLKETRESAQSILKEKGIDYSNWKNEVINNRKVDVMTGKDKKWIEQVVLEESLKLIVEDNNAKRSNIDSHNHGVGTPGNHNKHLEKGSER